jgi:hypothetical protein
MFSPDNSLLVTGTSMKKGETEGKMVFFDRNTFSKVHEMTVSNSVSQTSNFFFFFINNYYNFF